MLQHNCSADADADADDHSAQATADSRAATVAPNNMINAKIQDDNDDNWYGHDDTIMTMMILIMMTMMATMTIGMILHSVVQEAPPLTPWGQTLFDTSIEFHHPATQRSETD